MNFISISVADLKRAEGEGESYFIVHIKIEGKFQQHLFLVDQNNIIICVLQQE